MKTKADKLPKQPVSLVTGGAGFIGSHLSRELLKLGHTVVILDDLSGGFRENISEQATFVKGSILDQKLLNDLFEKYKFNYVYHFAAYAAEGLSHHIRNFNYTNNLIGSINLINLAVNHKVDCFIFASSIAVYGAIAPPMSEEDLPKPEDPYAIAKYAVELDLKAAHQMFDLNYIIFRPHNVYGEFQNLADPYRNVIGIFINQALKGEPLTIFGDGQQTRAFSYIGDITRGMANAVNIPLARNQVFNVGANKKYRVTDLADVVKSLVSPELEINYLEKRQEVLHAYADHSKFNRILGPTKQTTLEDGVKRMIDWAKDEQPRTPITFDNIEIEDNLPESWRLK